MIPDGVWILIRYAHWMDKNDQIHGLLKDGQSLTLFQRSFETVNLKIFLQIPHFGRCC